MLLITTLVVSFLVFCMLEVRCSYAGIVSGLQAKACNPDTTNDGHSSARNMLSL